MTLVSVCIPARNQAPFLAEAVASALAQDVDLEVLVHDDASTDATRDVLAGFDDPRLRVLRHHQGVGVAANRNSCLAHARGRYIAWLDADDVCLSGSLAQRVRMLEEHPEVGLVHGGFELIDADGAPLPPWPAPFDGDTVQPGPVAFGELITANHITTSTVVARSRVHVAAGPFSTRIGRSSTDWDMWLRISLRADLAYVAAPVARYRQHERTISHATSSTGERLRCNVRVIDGVLREERRRIPEPWQAARTARAALAAQALLHAGDLYTAGRRREAARAIGLAARLAPRTVGAGAARLLVATARGDDYASYRTTRALLGALSQQVGPTRYGRRLQAAASTDAFWEAVLVRVARRVRRLTPRDANVATVTKWDPTLLWLSGRHGVQFPDRRLLPDGYPREDATVIAHLEELRARGVTHIVFPSASLWWLEHYATFGAHLDSCHRLLHRDDDCAIYALGP